MEKPNDSFVERDRAGTKLRLEEVARLTNLLESKESFSFLRLGDGELRFLLLQQTGEWLDSKYSTDGIGPTCESAIGTLGLTAKDCNRLISSFENCDYLDTYDYQEYNRDNLRELRLNRSSHQTGPSSVRVSGILPDWTYYCLRVYLEKHRSIFCGAEAGILSELLYMPDYHASMGRFWPKELSAWFYLPPGKGSDPSKHLDEIKSFLREVVTKHKADTLFLSLGGAAKIICYELARECRIRAIDFGSLMRSLTYSGSDGQATWRASHHIFFGRVGLKTYMSALQKAHPEMPVPHLLAKAHAQLCLEFQKKVLMESVTSDVHDSRMFCKSEENIEAFDESYKYYRDNLLPLAKDEKSRELVREFDYWLLKKGIGFKGKLFRMALSAKGMLRRWSLIT